MPLKEGLGDGCGDGIGSITKACWGALQDVIDRAKRQDRKNTLITRGVKGKNAPIIMEIHPRGHGFVEYLC